jgi:ATP-binding protein involved in chromosome partitioning
MEITREDVLAQLSNIQEPDLKRDIVSLNLVEELRIEGNQIALKIKVVNHALHARNRMKEAVNFTLKKKFGDEIVTDVQVIGLPKEEQSIVPRKILPEVKHIVAVASGKGGVGKSTVTANLAAGLTKRGFKVGIIDADIYGPSMPTMFDVVGERPTMIDKDGVPKICPVMSYGVQILSIGFFTDQDNAVVWRGPMASKALNQMFTDSYWGELDYLLIDLPPGTGDIHLTLVQLVPLDGVVIVSTPQEVALADARRGVNMFKLDSINVKVLGLVENMAWFTPAELPQNKYYIFGKDGAKNLATSMNVPFLGQLPLIQSIREACDAGKPAVFNEEPIMLNPLNEIIDNFLEQMKRA